ncbi:GlsB/YeaQ/YmgE family stress response membrane protein [Parapedobacter sp. DT-150]|uniref:GlsB/YeaQ/YmgE family stress response membrane protein n=1 Tax=Parapedobacter sp. DT-150 TaxID=3396162 RepID=UPI003F1B03FA
MEKHVEEPSNEKSTNNFFYLLGAVFGGLTGGFTQESFLAAIIGAVVGLAFAGFFVGNLLKGREHDR